MNKLEEGQITDGFKEVEKVKTLKIGKLDIDEPKERVEMEHQLFKSLRLVNNGWI